MAVQGKDSKRWLWLLLQLPWCRLSSSARYLSGIPRNCHFARRELQELASALDPRSKLTGSTICSDPPTSLSLLGASSPCPSCT
eukprot:3174986-Rhodomonas_salina.1